MLRILIAGAVGGIAMFAWSAVAHMSPLGTMGIGAIANDGGTTRRGVVDHRVGAFVAGDVALFSRLQLGVEMPVVLFQSGPPAVPGVKGLNPVATLGPGDQRFLVHMAESLPRIIFADSAACSCWLPG